jgi:hypothetical protein
MTAAVLAACLTAPVLAFYAAALHRWRGCAAQSENERGCAAQNEVEVEDGRGCAAQVEVEVEVEDEVGG